MSAGRHCVGDEHTLRLRDENLHVGAFRTVIGNDETVWEGAGIEVPMISISRWPYDQYHTSEDNLDLLSSERLSETLEALKDVVTILEGDRTVQRKFKGLICLSNPKYGLYIERPEATINKSLSDIELRLGKLQDCLPRYMDGDYSVFEIADAFGVPFKVVARYLRQFQTKDLVQLRQLDSLDQYRKLARIPRGDRQYTLFGETQNVA